MTVLTPDGYRTIFSDSDIEEIIREYISDDMAELVSEKMDEIDEGREYVKMKFQSDFNSLEGSVENYEDVLVEVEESLKRILNYIDDKVRINRSKVYLMVQNVAEYVHKNI